MQVETSKVLFLLQKIFLCFSKVYSLVVSFILCFNFSLYMGSFFRNGCLLLTIILSFCQDLFIWFSSLKFYIFSCDIYEVNYLKIMID
jgi:hypothetical protein